MLASDVDVIVELAGGLDPAGGWVRRALEAGKSVVTANKKLIAYHGRGTGTAGGGKGRPFEVWRCGCGGNSRDSGPGEGIGRGQD